MPTTTKPKFNCGVILATPGASGIPTKPSDAFGVPQATHRGDWGEELCQEDRRRTTKPSSMALVSSRPTSSKMGPRFGVSPRRSVRAAIVRPRLSLLPEEY